MCVHAPARVANEGRAKRGGGREEERESVREKEKEGRETKPSSPSTAQHPYGLLFVGAVRAR